MPAAKLALEDVNGDKNLLPGFKLILHSNDSEVRILVPGIICDVLASIAVCIERLDGGRNDST